MAAEKNFEDRVKAYFRESGTWYIKYWAGAPYTTEGIPDILACHHGQFMGIEVKADTGRPTLLQLVTLQKIRDSGGYGILLYPDAFDGFKSFCANRMREHVWYLNNITLQENWKKRLEGSDGEEE